MAYRQELNGFAFQRAGYGQYKVTYNGHTAHITDMSLIDATLNADEPTDADWSALEQAVMADYEPEQPVGYWRQENDE